MCVIYLISFSVRGLPRLHGILCTLNKEEFPRKVILSFQAARVNMDCQRVRDLPRILWEAQKAFSRSLDKSILAANNTRGARNLTSPD
jgi:hypothetical protein